MQIIDGRTLRRRLDAGERPWLIHDVRAASFRLAHLPGAVGFAAIDGMLGALQHDEAIVVYGWDEQSASSHALASRLSTHGYAEVAWYAGGLADWIAAGLPVEGTLDPQPQPRILDHREPGIAEAVLPLHLVAGGGEPAGPAGPTVPQPAASPLRGGAPTLLGFTEKRLPIAVIEYRTLGDVLVIDRLLVHPRHRRAGLGRRLLTDVLQLVPHRVAFTATASDDRATRSLLERFGFRPTDDLVRTDDLLVQVHERVRPLARS